MNTIIKDSSYINISLSIGDDIKYDNIVLGVNNFKIPNIACNNILSVSVNSITISDITLKITSVKCKK